MALQDVLKPINESSDMNTYIKRYRIKEKEGDYKVELHSLWGWGPWICIYICDWGEDKGKIAYFDQSQRFESKNSALQAIKYRIKHKWFYVPIIKPVKPKYEIVEFNINDIANS